MMGERDAAFEYEVKVDKDTIAAIEFTAHVEPPWIGKRHAPCHQAAGVLQLLNTLKIGQLVFAVHAQDLPIVRRLGCGHRGFRVDCQRYNVGQVILFFRVTVGQLRQQTMQYVSGRAKNSGIDLADAFFLGTRVLLLDYADNTAGFVAHDAAVSLRIVERRSQQSQPGSGDQFLQRGVARERNVPIQHQRCSSRAQVGKRLLNRMTGAELGFLAYEFNGGMSERGWNRLAAVAVDDNRAVGPQGARSFKYVTDHGPAAERLPDLGEPGMHARPLASSKDHDVEWGFFHGETRR